MCRSINATLLRSSETSTMAYRESSSRRKTVSDILESEAAVTCNLTGRLIISNFWSFHKVWLILMDYVPLRLDMTGFDHMTSRSWTKHFSSLMLWTSEKWGMRQWAYHSDSRKVLQHNTHAVTNTNASGSLLSKYTCKVFIIYFV